MLHREIDRGIFLNGFAQVCEFQDENLISNNHRGFE
jgi:hypothetical protein